MNLVRNAVLKVIACLLVLVSTAVSVAEVPIPLDYYVPNRSGSQCVFCSLEILAYYHGIPQLYNLTDEYKHATGPDFVGRLLQERGVNHYQSYPGDPYGLDWCQFAIDNNFGCVIGVNGGSHAVVLIELNEHEAKIMENGTPDSPVHTMSRAHFRRKFSGWVVIIWNELEDPNVGMPNHLRQRR